MGDADVGGVQHQEWHAPFRLREEIGEGSILEDGAIVVFVRHVDPAEVGGGEPEPVVRIEQPPEESSLDVAVEELFGKIVEEALGK